MSKISSEDGVLQFFKVSKWKTLAVILFMCAFEYAAFNFFSTPYSELEANSDKYHPLVGYAFFGCVTPIAAILLVVYTYFFFQRDRGFYLTENGFIDSSTPFSVGEIPFERILQICDKTNVVTRFRLLKIRDNYISISLRGRKVDKAWWNSVIQNRLKQLVFKKMSRFGFYNVNTKVFSVKHGEIAEAVKKHLESHPRVKMYTMDHEQTLNDLKAKRKA